MGCLSTKEERERDGREEGAKKEKKKEGRLEVKKK